ncbi:hypothetical protein RvY_06590 [Ramazzottius varieornatus]|uniref:HTH psq-type domain-containing protein n=1 Tax=Ramazzottius varieornatus TaxID=947166 RepID=A0A1D1V8P7_RAMVA|nr:hypothetical protein RvY_06590 [Ramazzottius varieornatus]
MASSKLKTAAEVSRELMDSALYAVKKSGVSKKLAAKLFGVSRTTLGRRLQNPRPERHGGRTKFPAQVEDELVDLLTSCCIMGIPLNRYHCYQLFSQVAIDLGLKNTACSSTSFKNFLKRHKSLSLRISHASNRKQDREWTMEVCEQYISKLQKLKDGGFLDAPEQIWNLDETAFDTSQVVDTVVGVKGLKLVPSQFNGNAKECVTVLPCGNAAGLQLKFLALYSGKLHIQSRLQDTHNIDHHAEVKEFVENVQRGVTPASALARALAKSLMDDAPRKKRLQKNTMLNLKAGALITSDEFVETVEKMQADSAAKKSALKAADAATKAASKAAGKVTASAAEKAARKAEKAAEKVAEKTAKTAEKAATQAAKAVEKAAAKLAARDAKLSRIQKRKTVDDIPPPKRARKETCKA